MRPLPFLLAAAVLAGCAARPDLASPAQAAGPLAARAAAPAPVRAEGADGLVLTGEVTLPLGARGPVPVVVFLAGAGAAWDADYAATLPSGRRFQVLPMPELADACARAGLAFVRYAKRGHADPAAWKTATLANLQADARAMQAAVRRDPRFDPTRMAVVGHSEGSALATWTAKDVRAIALLGVVRRNLEAIGRDLAVDNEVPRSMRAFDRSGDGRLDATELEAALKSSKGAALARWRDFDADGDGALAPAEVRATYAARFDAFRSSLPDLAPDALLTPTHWLGPAPARWWREHFAHRAAGEAWRTARTPVLVLHGEADPVTPYGTEAVPLEAQLAAAKHPDHRLIGYPGLDHSFRDAQGTSQAARVFADLVPWLKARLAGG